MSENNNYTQLKKDAKKTFIGLGITISLCVLNLFFEDLDIIEDNSVPKREIYDLSYQKKIAAQEMKLYNLELEFEDYKKRQGNLDSLIFERLGQYLSEIKK